MKLLFTISSYVMLLLLIMPTTTEGVIQTLVFSAVGIPVLLWKKLWRKNNWISKSSCAAAVFFEIYLGLEFYNRWLPSSKIRRIAEIMHMSGNVLIVIVSVILSLGALYFVTGILGQIRNNLKKDEYKSDITFGVVIASTTVILAQFMIEIDILSMGIYRFLGNIMIVVIAILSIYCIIKK